MGQDAHHVEISDREAFVTVVWEQGGSRHETSFSRQDLARPWVPYKHRLDSTSPGIFLGALGRQIDQAGLNVASIVEDDEGFVVTGSLGGHYENIHFRYADLEVPSAVRPALRATPPPSEVSVAPNQHRAPLRERLGLS